ncbi:unnamed protein product [Malus baccata var. baccata]
MDSCQRKMRESSHNNFFIMSIKMSFELLSEFRMHNYKVGCKVECAYFASSLEGLRCLSRYFAKLASLKSSILPSCGV